MQCVCDCTFNFLNFTFYFTFNLRFKNNYVGKIIQVRINSGAD